MKTKNSHSRFVGIMIMLSAFLMPMSIVSADNSPLCFTARNGSVTVRFDIKNVTHTIQYSTDSLNWNTYTSNSDVVLNADQSVYFRAESNQTVATAFGNSAHDLCSRFYMSSSNNGIIEASGDIMSLYGTNSTNLQLLPFAFADLFKDCKILTSTPIMSAVNLAKLCYASMYNGCDTLTNIRSLPATTLVDSCYCSMFNSCRSIVTPPLLPATKLAKECYRDMFISCSSLTNAPVLPADTMADGCYRGMLAYCSSLQNPPLLPATTLAARCYEDMFTTCSSLATAPILPASILADSCYFNMFSGCTSLVNVSILPSTKLATSCYQYMFAHCTSLLSAPVLPADSLANYCYLGMFLNCSLLTTPPELPATILAVECYHDLFKNCTSLTQAPELPATSLADGCYCYMFYGCSSLAIPPALPATTLTRYCYHDMFKYCYGLLVCPELPATNLAEHCYERMFYYCTSLTSLPALPATTLPNCCYYRMFWGCSSLQVNTSGSGKQWSISAISVGENVASSMFHGTIGTMNSTPSINTTYRVASVLYHNVTASVNDNDMGGVCGTGNYERGSKITLNAIPNNHYHFVGWNNDTTVVSINLTVVKDTSFTANFAIDQHNVNVSATNGQVNGGGLHDYGSTVSLTASPNQHYHFVSWSDGNTSNPRSIVVNGDTTLTANFEIDKHTITSSGTHGTVSGGGTYDYGSTITLKATPNNHYYFARWSDNDTTNPRTITVSANKTYTAVFEGDMHTITTNATNGRVTGGGSYHYGSTVTLSATPNQHYHFKQWSDGNTSNPRTFSVYADSIFTAIFEIDKHTVSASGPNGTILGTGTYDYGSTATLSAYPNTHYHFVRWTDYNTTNPRTFTVYGNCAYIAIFEINRHVVTVGGTNGVVAGGGTYDYGSSATLTATADDHYHFARWSDGDVSNPRNIVVSGDLTYTALFEIDKHTVAVDANNGVVSGGGEYDYGSTVNLTAVPDDYYCDVIWSDGDSDLTKSFVVTGDVELTADFVKCQYVVSATCEHGEVTGSGVYENPEIVTLVAFADNGYRFVEWSDGNEYNPRVFVVEGDMEVEAICEVVAGVEDVRESVAFYYVNGRVVNPEGVMLRVYSTEGKMVKSSDSDIVTEGWPAGMYMVVDEKGSTLKVMVKK